MSSINPKGYSRTRLSIDFGLINITNSFEAMQLYNSSGGTDISRWYNDLGTDYHIVGVKFGQDDGNAASYEVQLFKGDFAGTADLQNIYNNAGTPDTDFPIDKPTNGLESELLRFDYPVVIHAGEGFGLAITAIGATTDETICTAVGYYNSRSEQW